jgi:hypothetical protein
MRRAHAHRRFGRYWHWADLVMKVFSPDGPKRDSETKQREYAQAGIPEYRLVDPRSEAVTVLTLPEDWDSDAVHHGFEPGTDPSSPSLPELVVDAERLFAQDARGRAATAIKTARAEGKTSAQAGVCRRDSSSESSTDRPQ